MDQKGVPAAASRRARTLGWWLFILCVGALAAWGHSTPASADLTPPSNPGAGVYALDHITYEVREGEALAVNITRTNGGTLATDVNVQVALIGGTPGFDYANSEITKIVKFPAGTNLTSLPVGPDVGGFVTINHNRAFSVNTISVQIQSVSGGGAIAAPQTSPVTIRGRGEPIVTTVSPRSGDDSGLLTIYGNNFSPNPPPAGTVCPSQAPVGAGAIPNPTPTPAPTGNCVYAIGWYLSGSPAFHTQATVISPTVIQTPIPSTLVDGSIYDVIVAVVDPSLPAGSFSISATVATDTFAFTTGPTITGVAPPAGPVVGGSLITITGTKFVGCPSAFTYHFLNGAIVTADAATLATCISLGANTFQIRTPNLLTLSPPQPGLSGPTFVKATFGTPTVETDESKFTYLGAPTINSVVPPSGPSAGGTVVTVFGTGFPYPGGCPALGSITISFGGIAATSCSVLSSTQLLVTAPPCSGTCPGAVQITVTVNSIASLFTTAANFTYIAGPSISSLDPNSGPPQGGGTVKIHGAGFAPGATVTFGGVPATFISFAASTELDVTAPAGTGMVDVVVSVNGVSSPISPVDLYTYSIPVVSGVLPNAGPPAGGTVVLINGANFTAGATVQFGPNSVPSTFVSTVQIQATVPALGSQGVVDVRVTTPNGQSLVNANDTFTYTSGPIIAAVNPASGPTTGGIPIIITGTNFAAGATVTFNGKLSDAVNFNSATQLTALLPPASSPGTVDVVVTTAGGKSPLSTVAKFIYNATVPVITAISPDKAATVGGQSVEITGVGFLGVTCPDGVKFGTVVATACTVNSDTSITAIAPANVPGQTFLVIQSTSGSSEITLNFTYQSTAPPVGGGSSGGGTGGSTSGGSVPGTQLPAPTGQPVSYSLSFRWTLIVWRGADAISITRALQGAATTPVNGVLPTDITAKVTAIYGWDPTTNTWLAYFGGPQVPGASNLFTLTRGGIYWIALNDSTGATWLTTDG